jgi:HlyD family secretion protein
VKPATAVRIVLVVAALGAGAVWFWSQQRAESLPAGFARGNGRIEAEDVNIATKYAGRVNEVLVQEGDAVTAGQVLARMDSAEIDAAFERAEATERQAEAAVAEAQAQIVQNQSVLKLAEISYRRALTLFQKGNVARETVDQRQSARDGAQAALAAAESRLTSARRSVEAAKAEVKRIGTQRDDLVLRAPRSGRVQYRLAEPGEVLPAGGRVVALIDLSDVTMTIFLPTREAGRARIGSEARIVLDAAPEYVIPAAVSFIAGQAQFTPKEIETRNEREKLMFRIKLRIDPKLLRMHAERVKTGLPGEAYVRIDPDASWPSWLEVKLPPPTNAVPAEP